MLTYFHFKYFFQADLLPTYIVTVTVYVIHFRLFFTFVIAFFRP